MKKQRRVNDKLTFLIRFVSFVLLFQSQFRVDISLSFRFFELLFDVLTYSDDLRIAKLGNGFVEVLKSFFEPVLFQVGVADTSESPKTTKGSKRVSSMENL